MAKLLKQAIQDVRNFYIQKLIDDGHKLDMYSLSSYTISELKKEYNLVINKERK
ncbi:Fur-regulated basic protein FbpA [Sutcliffiella halmapala]|uniref:Fur-regulated basic protein FbpA n=1 Tax=Sutcliffiella halmapala TaxID=79882 RepID=UPI0011178BA4|nr:Fur-regulated basic protein FbpA [Sutcliffiella halmapala]